MKRVVSLVFVIVTVCSLLFAVYATLAFAVNPSYSITVYGGADATIDGKWTTDAEWDDAATAVISPNAIFRLKYYFAMSGSTFLVYDEFLVEFFADKTNDTGDYVRICYDCSANGGSAPQTDDIRIDYVGHNGTIVTYKGTGSAWAPTTLTDYRMEELVSVSKLNGTNPHYTAELRLEKTGNGPDINNAIRVAVFDASNAALGEQAWPPGSNLNIPDGYGGDPADTTNPIPEGLNFEVMATLSFAAVLVGFYSLRKGPKNIWTR